MSDDNSGRYLTIALVVVALAGVAYIAINRDAATIAEETQQSGSNMSEGLNKAMLLGNLGADPELRYTQGGQPVLNLRLATTETYLDKDKVRRERTDWHSVVIWGKRGEALGKILAKGARIFVEGSIRTSSYDDKDGNKRYKTEIVANNVILTGARGENSEGVYQRGDTSKAAGKPRDSGAREAPRNADDYGSGSGGNDDDIPF